MNTISYDFAVALLKDNLSTRFADFGFDDDDVKEKATDDAVLVELTGATDDAKMTDQTRGVLAVARKMGWTVVDVDFEHPAVELKYTPDEEEA